MSQTIQQRQLKVLERYEAAQSNPYEYEGVATKSQDTARVVWGLCTNKKSGKRWYHIARIVKIDGKWYETYWEPDIRGRGSNAVECRKLAKIAGIELENGVFVSSTGSSNGPVNGPVVFWSEEN